MAHWDRPRVSVVDAGIDVERHAFGGGEVEERGAVTVLGFGRGAGRAAAGLLEHLGVVVLAGLAFGERVSHVARGGAFGQKGIADHLFIDAGFLDLDRHASITQERGADLGAGGKDDLDSHVDNPRVALWATLGLYPLFRSALLSSGISGQDEGFCQALIHSG